MFFFVIYNLFHLAFNLFISVLFIYFQTINHD